MKSRGEEEHKRRGRSQATDTALLGDAGGSIENAPLESRGKGLGPQHALGRPQVRRSCFRTGRAQETCSSLLCLSCPIHPMETAILPHSAGVKGGIGTLKS